MDRKHSSNGEMRSALLFSFALAMACFGACTLVASLIAHPQSEFAQNTPTPNAEEAEKNAFQTPTAGKDAPDKSSGGKTKEGHPDAAPESRMNDNPPAQEKVGAPNTGPK